MGAKDSSTELADIGDGEGHASFIPDNKPCSLWVVDHTQERTLETLVEG